MNEHKKKLLSTRYRLLGRADCDSRWFKAIEAMEFASRFHIKLRKDGKTPEFDHQLSIVQTILILPDLKYPVETVATGFLHDTSEDYTVSHEELTALFGQQVADSTFLVTKEYRGIKRDEAELFAAMSKDFIASIVKGCDNDHNVGSMRNLKLDGNPVFGVAKQKAYLEYANTRVLPMLKEARRNCPSQERAYEIVKKMLLTKCDLIASILPQESK